jgi:hypothetical protein
MKNWKTTVAGLVAGLPFAIDAILQAYTAGYFTDKTGWQLFGAIAVITITSLAKDHNVSGFKAEDIGLPKPKDLKE